MSTSDFQDPNEQRNPYAPPIADRPPDAPASFNGVAQQWEPLELLDAAWQRFTNDWLILIIAFFSNWALSAVVNGIADVVVPGGTIGSIINVCISVTLVGTTQAGTLAVFLASGRGESPNLETYLTGMQRYLPVFLQLVLVLIAVLLGTLFCVVPGFILALGLLLSPYYAAEGMGPIAAMRASANATEGHKLKIFLLTLVYLLLVVAGAIPCGLGLVVVFPLLSLTNALLYLRLSGRGAIVPAVPLAPEIA